MPNWGSTHSNGNWGGSTTVVFKDSKHPAQALQFAMWLNTSPQSITGLITKGGLYPADPAGQHRRRPTPLSRSTAARTSGRSSRPTASWWTPASRWGPIMNTTFTQMQDGFGKATGSSGSLSQVLSSTQSQTIAAMKKQGFSVKAG